MALELENAEDIALREAKRRSLAEKETKRPFELPNQRAAALVGAKIGASVLRNDTDIAIDNLIQLGYKDDEISKVMSGVDDQIAKLSVSNLTDDQIKKELYDKTIVTPSGNPNKKYFLFRPYEEQVSTEQKDLPIEPMPIYYSPAFAVGGAGPIAGATGLLGKAAASAAIGAAGGAVSPFLERKPVKEAIKEVPGSIAEGAITYAAGEALGYGVVKGAKYITGKASSLLAKRQAGIAAKEAEKAAKIAAEQEAAREIVTPGFGTVGESAARIEGGLAEGELLRQQPIGGKLLRGELAIEEATAKSKAAQLFEKKPQLKVVDREIITPGFGSIKEAQLRMGEALKDRDIRARLIDQNLRQSDDAARLLKEDLSNRQALGTIQEQIKNTLKQIDDINTRIGGLTKDVETQPAKKVETAGIDITSIIKIGPKTGPLEKRLEFLNNQLNNLSRQAQNISAKLSPISVENIRPPSTAEVIGGVSNTNTVGVSKSLNETANNVPINIGQVIKLPDGKHGIVQHLDDDFGLAYVLTGDNKIQVRSINRLRENEIKRIASEPTFLGGNEDRIASFSESIPVENRPLIKVSPEEVSKLNKVRNEDTINYFNDVSASTDTKLPFQRAMNKLDVEGQNVGERVNGGKIIDAIAETKTEGVQPVTFGQVAQGLGADVSKLSPDGGYVPPGTKTVKSPFQQGEYFYIIENVKPQLGDFAISKSTGKFGIVKSIKEGGIAEFEEMTREAGTGTARLKPFVKGRPFDVPLDDLGKMKIDNPSVNWTRHIRPLWATMDFLEKKTGLSFMNFHMSGNQAVTESVEMTMALLSKKDQIFKNLLKNDKKTRELRSLVTEIEERYIAAINPDGTVKIKTDAEKFIDVPKDQVAKTLGKNPDAVNAAIELRNAYDDYVRAKAIPEADRRMFYSPHSPAKTYDDMFKHRLDPRTDKLARFEHERKGGIDLIDRETDALVLWQKYIRDWAQAEFLFPWEEEIARPLLASISNSHTMSRFLSNYIDKVRGIPNQSTVDFNRAVYDFINNTIGSFAPDTAERFLKSFGDERVGEILGDKWANHQFKNLMSWRPTPIIVQHTQKALALPIIGETGLGKGIAKSMTAAGKARTLASGIAGSFTDLLDKHVITEKGMIKKAAEKVIGRDIEAFTPGKWFQNGDASNRSAVYNYTHDLVLNAWKGGAKNFDELNKVTKGQISWDLLPDSIVDRFKELYNAGKVGDVLEKGTANNAAHHLGYWTQWLTQFPNTVGGGIPLWTHNPILKQLGIFQSYSFFFVDYLARMTKQAVNSEHKTRDMLRVGRTLGYLTILDSIALANTGMRLFISPGSTLRLATSPVGATAIAAGTLAASYIKKAENAIINDTEKSFENFEREKAKNTLFRNTVGLFFPVGTYAATKGYQYLTEKKKASKSIAP